MNKFVVMGDPIQHSLSPVIHKLFAEQFDIEIEYTKLKASKNNLSKKINSFFEDNGKGVNLTSPLKEVVIKYISNLSRRAQQAQSVNTLYLKGSTIYGDNTDGVGFIRSLDIDLSDKDILILGAGGALKGILYNIICAQPSSVHIVNRSIEKADILAKKYSNITTSTYDKLDQKVFDVVINSTSILDDNSQIFKQLSIKSNNYLDLQYNIRSGFYVWCMQKGIQNYISGLGMLVEQAAEGFYIWHGVRPDTSIVLKKLKKDYLCKTS